MTGAFSVSGFDYDRGPLAQGFVDFEISAKKKLSQNFQMITDLVHITAVIFCEQGRLCRLEIKRESGIFKWTHNVVNTPKKEKVKEVL